VRGERGKKEDVYHFALILTEAISSEGGEKKKRSIHSGAWFGATCMVKTGSERGKEGEDKIPKETPGGRR